jgi:hypothetical protein
MNKHYRIIFLVIIFFFLKAEKSFALTVSPPLLELSSRPGEIISGEVKIFNESDSQATVNSSLVNFKSSGEDGVPSFTDSMDNQFGLVSWMKVNSNQITIQPSQWQSVPYSIEIPKNAEPGGHYATLFFSNQLPDSKDSVGIEQKVGILFLLKIDGDIKESGKIKEFRIGGGDRYFFEYTPLTFEVRFENLGNVHLKPQGTIDISNMRNRKVAELAVNKESIGGNVLPQSVRKFESAWEENQSLPQTFFEKAKYEWKNFRFGRYKADLKLVYGSHGEIVDARLYFWMIPLSLILILLAFAVLVIAILIFGVRRYNRWIVKRLTSVNGPPH